MNETEMHRDRAVFQNFLNKNKENLYPKFLRFDQNLIHTHTKISQADRVTSTFDNVTQCRLNKR